MLKLRRVPPVGGGGGPVVGPRDVVVRAQAEHGLDGEHHSWLGHAHRLVLGVVGDVRLAVEERVDSVPAVCPDHGAAVLGGVVLNHLPQGAEHQARLDRGNCQVQALTRGLHQPHSIGVGLGLVAHVVRLVQVRVVAVHVNRHVQVYDVAILEHVLIRNPVADDLVHRSAHGLGEVKVVERRRVHVELDALFV